MTVNSLIELREAQDQELVKEYLTKYATLTYSDLHKTTATRSIKLDNILSIIPTITHLPLFWNSVSNSNVCKTLDQRVKENEGSIREARLELFESFKEDDENFEHLLEHYSINIDNPVLDRSEVIDWINQWYELNIIPSK